jgi:shikimate-5-dehydrogenase
MKYISDGLDIARIGLLALNIHDTHELAVFVHDHPEKPLIAVGMGHHGRLSGVIAPISIVTHPLVPSISPQELSLAEVHQSLHLLGQLPARQFYIFGNNISHSMSPTLHNAGFRELGLPHHYSIYQTENVDEEVRNIMAQPDFGGASVTFPHKLQIGRLLAGVSDSAKLIGAVNTVVVKCDELGERKLRGDNTDWLGIKSCIEQNWIGEPEETVGLVIGAGGAARAAVFALQDLGFTRVNLVNRTISRSHQLACNFPTIKFKFFSTLKELAMTNIQLAPVIVACVPADDITQDDIPLELLRTERESILVEMAYRPRVTALMKVARNCDNWRVLQGTDVLKEQAWHQFRLWTGRHAPVSVMIDALEHSSH